MKKWTEGYVHLAMRDVLRSAGFQLIAGEYPGGSDHELYPLNITDPAIARDYSPDPRRHSAGELIPDIVALKGRSLILGEAKVTYNLPDLLKLEHMVNSRLDDLKLALAKFARERGFAELIPITTLNFMPTLIFTNVRTVPAASSNISYLVLNANGPPTFFGPIEKALLT